MADYLQNKNLDVVSGDYPLTIYSDGSKIGREGNGAVLKKLLDTAKDRIMPGTSTQELRFLTKFIPYYFPQTRPFVAEWAASGSEDISVLKNSLESHRKRCEEEMKQQVQNIRQNP